MECNNYTSGRKIITVNFFSAPKEIKEKNSIYSCVSFLLSQFNFFLSLINSLNNLVTLSILFFNLSNDIPFSLFLQFFTVSTLVFNPLSSIFSFSKLYFLHSLLKFLLRTPIMQVSLSFVNFLSLNFVSFSFL